MVFFLNITKKGGSSKAQLKFTPALLVVTSEIQVSRIKLYNAKLIYKNLKTFFLYRKCIIGDQREIVYGHTGCYLLLFFFYIIFKSLSTSLKCLNKNNVFKNIYLIHLEPPYTRINSCKNILSIFNIPFVVAMVF